MSVSTFSRELEGSLEGKEDDINGWEFLIHVSEIDNASLTWTSEGRITKILSDILKKYKCNDYSNSLALIIKIKATKCNQKKPPKILKVGHLRHIPKNLSSFFFPCISGSQYSGNIFEQFFVFNLKPIWEIVWKY